MSISAMFFFSMGGRSRGPHVEMWDTSVPCQTMKQQQHPLKLQHRQVRVVFVHPFTAIDSR